MFHPLITDYGESSIPFPKNLTNGSIFDVIDAGDSLFITGNFSTVFPDIAGGIHKINATTAVSEIIPNIAFGFNAQINAIIKDGNYVYIGGSFISYNGIARERIAKLNLLTGELDPIFDTASGFNDAIWSIIKDGNDLYVGGAFTSYKGTTRQYIAKLDATTGALDATFNTTTGFSSTVQCIVKDGSYLYVGGGFTNYKGTTRQRLAKISSTDGSLDTTFNTATGAASTVYHLIKDGNYLYVGGGFTSYKSITRQRIAKINAIDATLDTTFDTSTGANNSVYFILQDGASLYLAGYFTTYKSANRYRVVKISTTTAALDLTFDTSNGFDTSGALCLLKDNNDLYIGGYFNNYNSIARRGIAKLNATTAALDLTFDTMLGFSGTTTPLMIIKDNNSIYAVGNFKHYKGIARQNLAKINKRTWKVDTAFDTSSGLNSYGYRLAKIGTSLFIGGNFTTYKGITRQYICKVNTIDASLDITFDTSSGFNATVQSLLLDSNTIYVGGSFTSYRGISRQCIARLSIVDGNLDTAFDANSGFTGSSPYVYCILKSGDDLYTCGNFTAYKGNSRNYIAKLNSTTAALDFVFDPGIGFTDVAFNLIKEGDYLYVGGNFTMYDECISTKLAKINAINGYIDPAFNVSSGFDLNVNSLVLDNTGLYVGGNYSTYQGSSRQRICKLNKIDASVITSFDTVSGGLGNCYKILLNGNNLYMFGATSAYKGITYLSAVRLNRLTGASI